ncbi:hypothetical protein LTR10_016950 [Elasticomyces elasticus]|uniref:Kelch repeat protein n=1 Tax=Exophiala sideris TaxID=1016849 RepID=A0ABR0JF03_9EURO|nr:hypothetical protein LTR10_016950 [Elasticomyces elasticus]KAK5025204.1 hypothetical protein LTS07_008055 [Exophiala sideris]KAK5029248.1 hypothetical protein LTR13_008785 [Exophiala sideris]KAK5063263.1 hypothetical protein LTR69_003969 [Exophiala sideris]KAK5178979.1 hypothetical protein LTR44_008468 [Eurotiomycetes sp. CCFEE 6388]
MASSEPQISEEGYATPSSVVPVFASNHTRRRSLDSHGNRNIQENPTDIEEPVRRNSAFFEVGLGGDDVIVDAKLKGNSRPKSHVRFRSKVDIVEPDLDEEPDSVLSHRSATEPMPFLFPTLPRLIFLAFVLILVIPSLHTSPLSRADANPVGRREAVAGDVDQLPAAKVKRDDSPTVVCKRWGAQSAVVNGTMYYYGGRSTTTSSQTTDEWNNDFLALNLTTSWEISSPTLTGLPTPSGPPAISLGYLWNSYDSLYLYGGEFSDAPVTSPVALSTWAYDISSGSWSESSDPQTSSGTNSESGGQAVQRAAEGAGVSVPNLGRGYYFGGHLDGYTTVGWSQWIARVYLSGLLEYTFPGYTNAAITGTNTAGSSGLYRNITEGGTQDSSGFPERADGVLVYVPGYGKSGILIGLGGGTNATLNQMNIIDVYDIGSSTWYKQATSGSTPQIRVNPCAVAVSAPDGSSTQVHMYGGQNLIPYGNQTQLDDMWILTIPSFTWIEVDTSNQATPGARAGHSCNIWNAQMVVVGGYVGADLSCDSPGIYVFNTSSLSWQNQYNALVSTDTLNRQKAQQKDSAALQGSYGYSVPAQVQSVIGGDALGAATVTAPAESATQGPLATGSPLTYSVTGSGGSTATGTAGSSSSTSGSTSSNNGNGSDDKGSSGGSNIGAIVAGVIAGLLAVLASYLGFCVWLYRKQLRIYKNHMDMAQRQHLSDDPRYIGATGAILPGYSDKSQSDSRNSGDNRSANGSNKSGPRANPLSTNNPYRNVPGGAGTATAASSTEDLMAGQEPSFLGVVLNPRRSLRVVNRD